MPLVVLVRHGQASFGTANYDALSDLGREQAGTVAELLRDSSVRASRVISGSLQRQRATAAPIAAALGCSPAVDARWDEYDSDDVLSSHSASPIRQDRPPGTAAPAVTPREFQTVLEAALLEWIAAGDEGPAGESWPAFAARVHEALRATVAGLGSGETAVVCTSGGVVAAVCVAMMDVAASRLVDFNRVTVNAGLTRIIHGASGFTLVAFNEQGHLQRDGSSLLTYR